ncbi:hypothetical protein [uncultured Aquimarina sp.]|uniref:hypothetical protein n=1 Tax=uncultured Aquimarina sp. TaxID=575652 RepID=UPI00261E130B|nr:hypothetical protein [uncultured Aquimarina sp.]
MNLRVKRISMLLMIAVAAIFQSCSSEDDGLVLENENQLENIQERIEQYQGSIENIEAPEAMEQYATENTYASNAVFSLASLQVQALAYSSIFLSIPNDAEQQSSIGKSGQNTRTWIWSYGGVTLYYTVTSDAAFDYFTYDIEEGGIRRNFYEGRISRDGTFFEVRFNGEDGEFLSMTYNKTGSIINFTIEDGNNDKIELVFNEIDQSGSIKAYEAGVLTESFVWSSNGTGVYTNHGTGETFSWP